MKGCGKEMMLLVGNPNTGKTTLFNQITKSNEHVGNWHGVTIEEKKKCFKYKDAMYSLIDLPGIYSLDFLSYEEKVAIDYIDKHKDYKIINICDINNLARNLFLTLCLIEKGLDIVLAINSTRNKNNCIVDEKKLSACLGIDVVLINAQSGQGVDKLLEKALQKERINKFKTVKKDMLEDAKDKYVKIEQIIEKCCKKNNEIYGKSKLDNFLLHKFFSPIIFFGIMGFIFYLTFFLIGPFLSEVLMWLLENTFGCLLNKLFVICFGASSWLTIMINEALIGGIGTILSFLPQIVLLFFFLSVLEDSGYLSRVAFVFDDLLAKIGLSGKSIYTVLMGFGCSASAILTARNMDDKNAKLKTILVTPFLSCSARLPIYLAIGGAFFGSKNIFVILGLYVLGLIVAIFMSKILDKTILKSRNQTFILEFPPYRMISFKRALKSLYDNTKSFILRIGGMLISLNIIVWILSNFAFDFSFTRSTNSCSMLETIAKFIAPIFKPLGFSSWGLVVALLVGIVAKEGVVSTIMMFCSGGLGFAMFSPESAVYFANIPAVFAFLTFCLLYIPCLSTLVVMQKEIGGKWMIFAIVMQMFIAYVFAMMVYNFSMLCSLYGVFNIVLVLFSALMILFSLLKVLSVFKKQKCKTCQNCHKR